LGSLPHQHCLGTNLYVRHSPFLEMLNLYEELRQPKSIDRLRWKLLSSSTNGGWEESPGDLRFYKCVAVNSHILFIGGVSEEYSASKGYSIIPALSITKKDLCWGCHTRRWNVRQAFGDIPPERYGHTATRVGSKVFVFGGRDPKSTVTFNDLYCLDLDTMVWTKVEEKGNPSPRYDHTCTYVNNRLFIIGGYDSNSQSPVNFRNNVGIFNLENWSWENTGATVAIAGHIAIPYTSTTNPYILVFGGATNFVDFTSPDFVHTNKHQPLTKFLMLEIESKKWESIDAELPVELGSVMFHAATWRHKKNGAMQVFIHGGFKDGSDASNHTLILTIEQHRMFSWTTPVEKYYSIVDTPVLRHHNMFVIEDELYLLGGMKDLGRQPSPYFLGCFPCLELLNYTSVYKISLPEE